MKLLATMDLTQYAPDQPDLNNPGLEVARNVLPRLRGYDSLPELQPLNTQKLTERVVGAFSAKDSGGTSYIFAGGVKKLWQLSDTQWVDVSRTTPIYADTTRWEFTKFGNLVIAASPGNAPQKLTLGGTNFADLTATTPLQGATVASMRGFTVLGDIVDSDGTSPWRVRWGPLNDPEGDWTPSPTTLADFNDLRTVGGRVQRVVGGEFGMVFRERSIWRMTFVGSPIIWQFDEVDPSIGTLAPGSVVQHGARVFFASEDGMRMTVGDASSGIGEERIDLTFLRDLDQAYLDRITGAVYTDEQIIVWAYPGPGNVGGRPNRLLIYNYAIDRWAIGDEAVEILFRASTPFRSIDGFDDDATFGGTQSPPLYSSVDDIPGSLDDNVWAGGGFQLGAIDSTRDLSFFTGPPRAAQFETGERQLVPGRRSLVTEMRSLADLAQQVEVEIGHRSSQRDPVVWTSPMSPTTEGFIPARTDDRYLRWRVTLPQGFVDAVGLEVYGEQSGAR